MITIKPTVLGRDPGYQVFINGVYKRWFPNLDMARSFVTRFYSKIPVTVLN